MNVHNLVIEINNLAMRACKKMPVGTRARYFKYQKNRKKNGEALKLRYDAGIRYYKGARKGQIREVYNIEGSTFNTLWERIKPYAYVSILRSFYGRVSREEMEDSLSDIKYQVFYTLRYWGPSPCGNLLSDYLKLIVNNNVSSNAVKRGIPTKKQKDNNIDTTIKKNVFRPISLFEEINSITVANTYPASEDFSVNMAGLPVHIKEAASLISGGESVNGAARLLNISEKVLKQELREYFADFK